MGEEKKSQCFYRYLYPARSLSAGVPALRMLMRVWHSRTGDFLSLLEGIFTGFPFGRLFAFVISPFTNRICLNECI